MLVHLTVSPTLIEIGFGSNAKETIEFVTVFGVDGSVVIVVVVVVGGGVVAAGGLVMVVDSGVVVGVPTTPVVVVARETEVAVDEGLMVPTVV